MLNITDLRPLSRVFGDEMQTGVGQAVHISAACVAFHGEQVRGIRVTP